MIKIVRLSTPPEGSGDAVKGGSKITDDIVKQGQNALNNFDINSS